MVEKADQRHPRQDVAQDSKTISETERAYVEQKVTALLKSVPEKMAVEEFFRVIAQTFGEKIVYDNDESTSIYNSLDIIDPLTDLVYSISCQYHTPFFVCSDLSIGALDSLSGVSIWPRSEPSPIPTVFVGNKPLSKDPEQQIAAARFLPEYTKDPKNLGKDIAWHSRVIWELVREQFLTPSTK